MCLLRGTDWVFIYNSTFCPHSVFMCFMWISEQTAIISLYSINWLVFVTETECVYCAVRTGSSKYSRLKGWLTVIVLFMWSIFEETCPLLPRSPVCKFLGRVSVALALQELPTYQSVASAEYKTRECCLLAVAWFSSGIYENCTGQTSFYCCQHIWCCYCSAERLCTELRN